MLKNWSVFEKLFLLIGTCLALILAFTLKASLIDLVYVLLYFWTSVLLAKGKYICYIIGMVSTFFYAFVSYKNAYYGEVIIALLCTLPLMIFGLINWLHHQDDTNTVIVKEVSKKELVLLLLSQLVLFIGYYYLLKQFNTNNLLVSTISIVASVIATYLTARRSEYGFLGYIINDAILIVLWCIPVFSGKYELILDAFGPTLLIINDSYGIYNWKKIKKYQEKSWR